MKRRSLPKLESTTSREESLLARELSEDQLSSEESSEEQLLSEEAILSPTTEPP
jgi:hypothetical protein